MLPLVNTVAVLQTVSMSFLAPYAELNYKKHLADAKEWVAEEKREDYARAKTRKDIYDAMQSLEYEINTLFTSNGQTPFTSSVSV